jgi:hypothetical protein
MRPPSASAQSVTLAHRRQFSRHWALDLGTRGVSGVLDAVSTGGVACAAVAGGAACSGSIAV